MDRLPVERALAAWSREAPAAAARAGMALELLLAGRDTWSDSSLTGDGYPVEMSFASAGGELRYTSEAAGTAVPAAERLDHALTLLARLGAALPGASPHASPAPAPWLDQLRHLQARHLLRFGTWIGGRHGALGDAYKLYLEVPGGGSPEADRIVAARLGGSPPLVARTARLRMIGWDPPSGRVELYFRADGLEPWELHRLAGRVGLGGAADDLLALLAELADRSIGDRLPCRAAGFSLSLDPPVLSLFFLARNLLGGDAAIRRRLLDLAARRRWPIAGYGAVTEPLEQGSGRATRHGMTSLGVCGRGPFLHVGVRPPDDGWHDGATG